MHYTNLFLGKMENYVCHAQVTAKNFLNIADLFYTQIRWKMSIR